MSEGQTPARPSQAEGDRETVEQSLGEQESNWARSTEDRTATGADPMAQPSQSEGDRETVEEDLREKGVEG